MFRIEAFCDDKNLARIYHVLAGLVLDIKVQPVANAIAVGGTVKARTNGEKVALFKDWAKQHHAKEVSPAQLKAFSTGIGLSPKSYSVVLTELLKAKAVRKIAGTKGNKTKYAVTA